MVVNAPCAVLRLHDGSDLSGIWAASHIPVPLSEPYHAETAVQTGFPLWAKRVCGDAGGREVRFVASGDALQELASHIKEDTSARYMLSPHVEGDVVKCYGVLGTPFFAWRYALTASAASSDAPERHNAPLQAYPFDESALMQLAGDAARAAGLCVFGADIVVKPDGSFALIDLNDFPSFQGFHAEAAQAIARLCFAKTGQQPSEQ